MLRFDVTARLRIESDIPLSNLAPFICTFHAASLVLFLIVCYWASFLTGQDECMLSDVFRRTRFPAYAVHCLGYRVGIWKAHDTSRAPAQTSKGSGPNTARIRPGANQAGKSREEAGARHQEECQEWPDWSLQDPGQGPSQDETVYMPCNIALYVRL